MMLFYDYFMVYGTNTIGDHVMEWKVFFPSRIVSGGCRGKPSCCRSHMGLDESFAFLAEHSVAPRRIQSQ